MAIVAVKGYVANILENDNGTLDITIEYRDQNDIVLSSVKTTIKNDSDSIMQFKGAVKMNCATILNGYQSTDGISVGDTIV